MVYRPFDNVPNRPPKRKTTIVMDASTVADVDAMQHAVASRAAREFSRAVARPKNYAALLSEAWAMAQSLLEQVGASPEPLPRKIGMLKDVLRMLPLLDKAESRHRVHLKKRAVPDLDDDELAQAAALILKGDARALARNKLLAPADNKGVGDAGMDEAADADDASDAKT